MPTVTILKSAIQFVFGRVLIRPALLWPLLFFTLLVGCASSAGQPAFVPLLNDDRAGAITAGMTGAAVEAAIGRPYQRVRFDNLKATAWDYRYIDTWGYVTEFAVMIGDDGRVVNKVASRVDPPDR